MNEAYKELEDIRDEMESLKLEYKAKCQLTEGLRRTLDDLLVKFQSTGLDVEKQAKEIAAKSEKIAAAQLRYEELERKLQEKDSALKQLSLSSESSRAGFKEKIKELEQANKELVAALDEANIKAEGEEKIICAYKREIEGLKGQMYQLQRKCSDAELRAQAPGELRRRGEMLDQLEREKGEIEDRLKWKSEQFMHLEEALSKVQGDFQASKKDWRLEKTNLLNHISSLQSNLDSLVRDANELRTQLEMANHALAHEERRRRLLEIQISKSKEMYENIVLEYEEAKSNIETLSTKRDEEIASLRNFLSAKMMLIKDLEYKKAFLEQENQELLNAWQEARNVQCNGVDASSVKALAQKYRSLELAHKECSKNLKAREDYWKQHIHKLTAEHDECLLTLNSKNQEISLLETDLEDSNCLLTRTRMENDEMSILIALLKSKFTEICCDVQRYNLEVEQHNRKTEVRVTILREQLENRTVALIQALAELSKERKMVESLKTRIEKLEYVKNEYITLQKELNSCESVLTELAENVDRITEEAALMEIDLKENLREVSYTLDEANISLSEKMCSLEEVEFKLREQRKVISHSEHVKCDLDAELKRYHQENYETRTRMEPAVLERKELEKLLTEEKESFHRTLEEKERRIHELEQQNIMLQEQLAGKDLETSAAHKTDLHQLVAKENQAFQAFAENVHRRLNFMLAALETLELNHKTGVDGILINLEESKSRCLGFLEEKLCVITDIKECIMSCDQERIRLVEEVANYKHADMFLGDTKLHEELDNIISAQILDKQEMKYRNFLISELEKDVASLQVKLESEEKLSSSLAGSIKEIQAQLGKEKFQVDIELCNSLRFLENKKETQVNRGAVIEIMEKFPPWKEVLIEQMKDFHAFLCKVNNEGEDMRKHWEKIYQKASFLVETDIHIEGEEPASSKQ